MLTDRVTGLHCQIFTIDDYEYMTCQTGLPALGYVGSPSERGLRILSYPRYRAGNTFHQKHVIDRKDA